jgi:hypothetical protein
MYINIPALQMGPQQVAIFSKTAPTILIKFKQFMDTTALNKTAQAVSSYAR